MIRLRHATPAPWLELVNGQLDPFLQDHAANERKVSASALTLCVQYPDHRDLCAAMIDVAREELEHFKLVYDVLVGRGRGLAQDAPDPYMGELRRWIRRRDRDEFLLDRLLLFAVIEARGRERFRILAAGLGDRSLRALYLRLSRAEARHQTLFLELARQRFPSAAVDARLDAILDREAEVVRTLPLRPALH